MLFETFKSTQDDNNFTTILNDDIFQNIQDLTTFKSMKNVVHTKWYWISFIFSNYYKSSKFSLANNIINLKINYLQLYIS